MTPNTDLFLDVALNVNTIPMRAEPYLLYMLVEIGGGQVGAVRLPVHLALVVDKSDSMMIRIAPPELQKRWVASGYTRELIVDGVPSLQVDLGKIDRKELEALPRPIDAVQESLRMAVEMLKPQDRFALILFAGRAVTLLPLSPASERRSILAAFDDLEKLNLGDDTLMGRGMSLGLDELGRSVNPTAISRMIVLTDGYTSDEADCRTLARRAQAMGAAISTMGLGDDFNEDLLIPIADETGGHAYRMDTLDEISAAFRQELNAVQSIAYRNLELKLRLSQGVELRAIHRARPMIAHLGAIELVDRNASIVLGDYELNEPPALLLELLVPPRPAPGPYRLAQLALAYDDPAGSLTRQTERQDVVVQYAAGNVARAAANPRVMNTVERVLTFNLQTRALQDLRQGNREAATRKLETAATRLLDMGETDLAATVQEQVRQLTQQGQIDSETAKAAQYKTRKLARRK